MKTPHLLASFAVAATASAAEFKDPSEVAQGWKENTADASGPLTGDLSLRSQIAPPRLPVRPVKIFDSHRGAATPPELTLNPLRPEPLYDAPRNRPPEVLPNNVPMPRGAKPWLYGGQTYWLMPLIPSREK